MEIPPSSYNFQMFEGVFLFIYHLNFYLQLILIISGVKRLIL